MLWRSKSNMVSVKRHSQTLVKQRTTQGGRAVTIALVVGVKHD